MKPLSSDWRDTLGSMLSGMAPDAEATNAPEQDEKPSTDSSYPLQKLRFDIEKKGRGGKTATIISGFTLEEPAVNDIAAMLKKKLGTGGSARGGEILIQGDRRDEVKALLRQSGLIK